MGNLSAMGYGSNPKVLSERFKSVQPVTNYKVT